MRYDGVASFTLKIDWTLKSNLFDADELDLLRFSFEPWILLWLELIALDVNVFARLSPRIGYALETSFDATISTILGRCESAKTLTKAVRVFF